MRKKLELVRSTDPRGQQLDLTPVLDKLRLSREVTHNIRSHAGIRALPSAKVVKLMMEDLQAVLFPSHLGHSGLSAENIDVFVESKLHEALMRLTDQLRCELSLNADRKDLPDIGRQATGIAQSFIMRLPEVRNTLVSDLTTAVRSDPAASSLAEVLLTYPGPRAIIAHRLAHVLYGLGMPLLARFISEQAHAASGIDIHPGATIGEGFFIDHGTGVVIGETAILGRNVRLYHAVTLGAKSIVADGDGTLARGKPRHPVLEDNVVVYAGATILGRIVVGRASIIGGNVWLTRSVPPGSIITQAQSQSGGPEARRLQEELTNGYGI